jgi:hypothetical protein
MIIGVISFFMFVLKETTALKKIQQTFLKVTEAPADDNCEELTDILWEKVHMFLFELMVLYIIICMYLLILHVLVSRYFSMTEAVSHCKSFSFLGNSITRRKLSFSIQIVIN